jgi:uncharacterized circularly permuted ATP-grasp superfamily protein
MELASPMTSTFEPSKSAPVAFDEMRAPDGSVRSAYVALANWLDAVPKGVLDYRSREAEFIFLRIGITFALHGDAEAQERLIPFDIIPRIIAAKEWARLARGLDQRVKALNAYIRDVYGKREILRAALVP